MKSEKEIRNEIARHKRNRKSATASWTLGMIDHMILAMEWVLSKPSARGKK